jgi:predicted nucleic acid-binding protein
MGSLKDLMGRRAYLDANVFIYALNDFPPFARFLNGLFEASDAGRLFSVTSELTLAEVLVLPLRRGDARQEQRCRDILTPDEGLDVVQVSTRILEQSARMRASNPALRLPDAIHVATAIQSNCDWVLTNDRHFQTAQNVPVMLLSEAVSE